MNRIYLIFEIFYGVEWKPVLLWQEQSTPSTDTAEITSFNFGYQWRSVACIVYFSVFENFHGREWKSELLLQDISPPSTDSAEFTGFNFCYHCRSVARIVYFCLFKTFTDVNRIKKYITTEIAPVNRLCWNDKYKLLLSMQVCGTNRIL